MNTVQQSEHASFVRLAARLCLIGAVVGVVSALVTGFVPPAVADDRYSYPSTTSSRWSPPARPSWPCWSPAPVWWHW